MQFNWDTLGLMPEDQSLAYTILDDRDSDIPPPDLVIAPDDQPYLYRWHLIPHNKLANLYFHIQVGSDPERPLHDHPWDNMSVILTGGYDEIYDPHPWLTEFYGQAPLERTLRKGDVVFRPASLAHRLILPAGVPYTMTLFSTGPHVKKWGFWFKDGWRDADLVTHLDPDTRKSVMNEEACHDASADHA